MKKWNFRENLLYLRAAYGETQDELARSLGDKAKATISQYESGTRKPNVRKLEKIAIHYNITVEELCYGDLGYLADKNLIDLPIDNWIKTKEFGDIIFPIFEPLENKCDDALYVKGYEIQKKLKKFFCGNEKRFDSKSFEMCHDYYVESINENGTVEAAANLLWLYVWMDVIWNNRNLVEGVSKLYDKKIDKRFFYQNYILKSFCENEDEAYTIGDGCCINNKTKH